MPRITLLELTFWYCPHIYTWVFLVVSFPQVSPPKPCTHLSCLPYVPHAPPITFFLILSMISTPHLKWNEFWESSQRPDYHTGRTFPNARQRPAALYETCLFKWLETGMNLLKNAPVNKLHAYRRHDFTGRN